MVDVGFRYFSPLQVHFIREHEILVQYLSNPLHWRDQFCLVIHLSYKGIIPLFFLRSKQYFVLNESDLCECGGV